MSDYVLTAKDQADLDEAEKILKRLNRRLARRGWGLRYAVVAHSARRRPKRDDDA